MSSDGKRQYTLTAVPSAVDSLLRKKAEQEGRTLNDVAVEALQRGLGLAAEEPEYDDLDDLIGTWEEDPDFEAAIGQQDEVDPRLWR